VPTVVDHQTLPAPRTDVEAVEPLLPTVGRDTRTPLVTGGDVVLAGLDNAATAPALQAVADHVVSVLPYYGSVHRGAGLTSRVSTDLYEAARAELGRFVGAREDDVVVITRNTTDALTLLAHSLPTGASVVHLDVEHHANILPWRGHHARVVVGAATVGETLEALEAELRRHPTALLAVTGASNVTGEALPLAAVVDLAHRNGARVVVDAAQLAPHRRIDLTGSGVDYVAFSGHKLYAPFGAGALIGRRDWLDAAPAYLPGGGSVREVSAAGVTWLPSPARHEGGTPNLLGAVALATAARTLAALPDRALEDHERSLHLRLERGLDTVPGLTRLRLWTDSADRVAVSSFVIDGWDSGLVATVLSAEHGVAVRDGRFCAHPLLARLSPSGVAVRASIGAGTGSADIDRLVSGLRSLVADGPRWTYQRTEAGWAAVDDPRRIDPFGVAGESDRLDAGCEPPAVAVA
jgi:selenocysteine lyase/cysteine desulfurase